MNIMKICCAALTVAMTLINSHANAALPINELTHDEATTTVYLVRHGEKQPGRDPLLTIAGEKRAQTLATLFKDVKLTSVYSTNYQRTIHTATPTARLQGLVIQQYNPRALREFATELSAMPGKHLVVGHSNTTHELAKLLGAKPGMPIDDKTEFNRFYVIHLSPPAMQQPENAHSPTIVSSKILRY
ncbi:histidine phosphatase family protein [Shewanella maritima]|uniref:Histidine phosphatase family protein n=1 Tax=Shewanella maritima TaxID=2520507 RepID=A0A411PLX4_9GAMM|nr:phosphoglycerate mutase family protein [Shewanella maritima]QBF84524.1 histidine phosphatase family protein [Shewanella maritima]